MERRPESLDELWSEKDLCERFGLQIKGKHSAVITHWIKGGLKCVEKGGRRYFFEEDVINFFLRAREGEQEIP